MTAEWYVYLSQGFQGEELGARDGQANLHAAILVGAVLHAQLQEPVPALIKALQGQRLGYLPIISAGQQIPP